MGYSVPEEKRNNEHTMMKDQEKKNQIKFKLGCRRAGHHGTKH